MSLAKISGGFGKLAVNKTKHLQMSKFL